MLKHLTCIILMGVLALPVSGLVVCVGSSGHVAVEMVHNAAPCEAGDSHESADFVFPALEAGCTDLALSQPSATRPSNSSGDSVKPPVFWVVMPGENDYEPMPALMAVAFSASRDFLSDTGPLRALRSVILLV